MEEGTSFLEMADGGSSASIYYVVQCLCLRLKLLAGMITYPNKEGFYLLVAVSREAPL